jgi:hypothetical protein
MSAIAIIIVLLATLNVLQFWQITLLERRAEASERREQLRERGLYE